MRFFTKKIPASPPMLLCSHGKKQYVTVGNAQIKGQRKEQQDSFGWSDINLERGSILAVLSDGMGGLADGMVASKMVVKHFITSIHSYDGTKSIPSFLEKTTEEANELLHKENQIKNVKSGATLVAAIIVHNELYWASVGDSRLYLLRNEGLYQINEDHNLENFVLHKELQGEMISEQLTGSLSSYLGTEYLADIDFNRRAFYLQDNDCIILCTDGIYQAVTEDEIKELLHKQSQSAADKITRLVTAKNYPKQDNATIMILNFKEEQK
ncbi:MAG: hypothetical protein K0S76_2189 [Herbinix sp.]|jgi:protein phosphatase|nr:hypothetical protein [Herbinix sp.]